MITQPVQLKGMPGSPYTRKMLAYLRFRHINYELHLGDQAEATGLPSAKVNLLPTFYLPNAQGEIEAVVDSTPIIRRFETEVQGRAAIPTNPVLGFLNYLIEDYADEWLTKAMFHYRWSYEDDIEKAGQMLPRWTNTNVADAQIAPFTKAISERQIGRLSYVGSNETTRSTIEESFIRFLGRLDKVLTLKRFVLGNRASSCDFAIFGQLTCLALFDPTPQKIIVQRFPRIYAWTEFMEDLSGYEILEDDWLAPNALSDAHLSLLTEIGELYLPYLLANAQAVMARQDLVETIVDGKPWVQNPFPYQAKCLQWLREAYAQLPEPSGKQVDALLPQAALDILVP